MREPTEKELTHLKAAFTETWPDAARAIKLSHSYKRTEAACLWLGFKSGYILSKDEAEG